MGAEPLVGASSSNAIFRGVEWHNITDPASPELDQLAQRYRLHPLPIEDCRHLNQSAKIEEGEGYLFAVIKVMRLIDDGSLQAADLDVFFGQNFVIIVEEEAYTPWYPASAFSRRPDHVRKC